MCTEVFVRGELCGSVGELRAVLGEIVHDDVSRPAMCLCGLDSKKTAARHGMKVVIDDDKYGFGVEAFLPA